MIISASRRTDIPAFYSEWLVNRLRQGFVLVRNPMNYRQVSRIALSPGGIECLVFWTKNPKAMMARLSEIETLGYPFYFLFTLTAYDESIEQSVPAVPERIAVFRDLAARIGREKVIWRYDPILFTGRYPAHFHLEAFARIAGHLAGFTERCIVSFLQMYRKCERNMRGLDLAVPAVTEQAAFVGSLRDIAGARGIELQSCAQGGELGLALKRAGIVPARCIDGELVARLTGTGPGATAASKDRNQRPECGCIESIDIGAYNSCPHCCLYCYANSDRSSVARNLAAHAPDSPLLYGGIDQKDRITERKICSSLRRQPRLF